MEEELISNEENSNTIKWSNEYKEKNEYNQEVTKLSSSEYNNTAYNNLIMEPLEKLNPKKRSVPIMSLTPNDILWTEKQKLNSEEKKTFNETSTINQGRGNSRKNIQRLMKAVGKYMLGSFAIIFIITIVVLVLMKMILPKGHPYKLI